MFRRTREFKSFGEAARALKRQFIYEWRDEIRHEEITPLDEKNFLYVRISCLGSIYAIPVLAHLLSYVDGPEMHPASVPIIFIGIIPAFYAYWLTFHGSRRKLLHSTWITAGGTALGSTANMLISEGVYTNNYYIYLPIFAFSIAAPLLLVRFYPVLIGLTCTLMVTSFVGFPLIFDPNAPPQLGAFIIYGVLTFAEVIIFILVADFTTMLQQTSIRAEEQNMRPEQTSSLLDVSLEETNIGLICFGEDNRLLFTRGDMNEFTQAAPHGLSGAQANLTLLEFSNYLGEFGIDFEKIDHSSKQVAIGDQYFLVNLHRGESMTVFTFVNVTEQRDREDAAQNAQKLGLVGQLASGIAHDYNNMLSIALSNLEAFPRPKHPHLWREYLYPAVEAIDLAKNVSRKLLTLSGRGELDLKPVRISTVINGMKPIFYAALQSDAALEIDIDADGMVRVDHGELEASLLNLVLNARHAMKPKKRGRVHIYTEHEDGEIVICVEDNGSGVPDDLAGKIFDPFFTTRKDQYSTGLGLSMVKGFLEQAGGRIELNSSPGKTIFRITLPLLKDTDKVTLKMNSKTNGAHEAGDLGAILIVDDNVQLLNSIARLMRANGVKCYEASSAVEATKIVEMRDVSIALLDLSMPDMSGIELGTQLLKIAPELRCFIITGAATNSQIEALTAAGFEGLIQKPVRVGELIERLSRSEALSA